MTEPFSPVPVPAPPSTPGRLGDKVEKTLQRVAVLVYNALHDTLVNLLASGVELFLDVMERVLAPRIAPMIDSILAEADVPPSVRTFLGHIKNPTSQADAIGAMSFASGAAGGLGGAMLGPVFRRINQRIDAVMQTAVPDMSNAWRMLWRNPAEGTWLRDAMLGNGWGPKNQELWKSILQPRLGAADLLAHQYRTRAGTGRVDGELRRRGYSEETITQLQKLSQLMPGPTDLISMGVREAWRDDVAARWGYDEDFPAEFAVQMERLGDKDGWARKYWRAHWQLPGLTTALEALHRLPDFDINSLDEFLRISDIPAGWRDVIKRLAFTPYTRVDTRRMFKAGTLTVEDVYNNYLALGYDAEHATNMTAFTVDDALEENRAASKTDILKGYREGMLTAGEAEGWLVELGYTADVASYLVAQETAKRARALTDAQIDLVKDQYINFDIDVSQARGRLTALNLSASEIDVKIESWTIDRERKIKHPSQSDVTKFFRRDQIDLAAFTTRLQYLGFPTDAVELYVANALYEKAEAARLDEERAREEQERIGLREIKSDYQRDKAVIDVTMAEVRAAIVDQQIAIQARTRRFRSELAITVGIVTVAEIQEEARVDIVILQADIQALREAQGLLRSQIETQQGAIATSRLTQTEYLAGISARLPEITASIVELEGEQERFQQAIDLLQTQIAAIRLQETEYTETVRLALLVAVREEDAAQIELDAVAQMIEFERQRRVLEVEIEETQDWIAERDVQIRDLSAVGRPDDVILLEFEQERRRAAVSVEEAQSAIADAATELVTLQGAITSRQALLVEQIDVIGRLQTEEALRLQYDAEITTMHETLGVLRAGLSRLQEDKAGLALTYREELLQ